MPQEHFPDEFARDSCADVFECVCAKMLAIWFSSYLAFFTLSTEGASEAWTMFALKGLRMQRFNDFAFMR